MQTIQEEHKYPLVPNITYPHNTTYSFVPQVGSPSPASHTIHEVEPLAVREYKLIVIGRILATLLANTLDQLGHYNEEAIHPIVSIIQPYMTESQDMSVHMPPKASREIVLQVTKRGRVKPKAFLD